MFSVDELIEIIKNLYKNASFENICISLGKKRNRLIFSNDKAIIKGILLNNSNIFEHVENLNIWRIKNGSSNISINNKSEHKKDSLKEIGNWKIFLKSWAKDDFRTVIRNKDASIDITMLKDGKCKIWSSHPIKGITLNNKSTSKAEVRPYWYIVEKSKLNDLFKDLDGSIINLLNSKSYNRKTYE